MIEHSDEDPYNSIVEVPGALLSYNIPKQYLNSLERNKTTRIVNATNLSKVHENLKVAYKGAFCSFLGRIECRK